VVLFEDRVQLNRSAHHGGCVVDGFVSVDDGVGVSEGGAAGYRRNSGGCSGVSAGATGAGAAIDRSDFEKGRQEPKISIL